MRDTSALPVPVRIPARILALLLAGLLAGLVTGCSGPSGVELSHDWRGVDAYVAVEVDGLVTLDGLDPGRADARPLAVLPDRADDDDVTGSVLARRRDGATLLIRPTTGRHDTLYRVRRGDDALTRVGRVPSGARLLGWADGWAEVVPDGSGTVVRVLDGALAQVFAVRLPVAPDVVAGDGVHRLCVGGNDEAGARIATVDLSSRRVTRPVAVAHAIGVLGCTSDGPVVGVDADPAAEGEPSVRLVDGRPRSPHSPPSLAATGGRLDAILVEGGTAYALLSRGAHVSVLTVDLASGTTRATRRLGDVQVVDDAFLSGGALVVAGDDRAAVLALTTGEVTTMALDGVAFPG